MAREKDDPRNFVESSLPLSLILFSRPFDSYLDGILKKLGFAGFAHWFENHDLLRAESKEV